MDETISTLRIEIGASSDDVQSKLNSVSASLRNLRGATGARIKVDAKGVDRATKKIGALANTLNSLKRIAFYRVIRSAIKAVGEAFNEGAENAYWYSKTVGESTKYISDAYDRLSSGSFKMTNQLGAAWATLKAALEPVLMAIINLVTKAANAITQLFAVLGGRSTYLQAIDYTKEWADTTAGGARAAKEWKNQLMGFDEINRLEEPSKGGGGGGALLPDYENMFQEAEVEEPFRRLGERIKELIPLFEKLGIVLAGLGFLKMMSNVLGLGEAFGGFTTKLMGFVVAVAGAILLWDGFKDSLNNGLDWGNLIEMLAGAALMTLGLASAFGTTGAAIGLLIGGVALVIAGVNEWTRTGQASIPVLTAISVGVLAIGAAIALLTGSWIPMVIAAIGAAVVWIVGKWDTIKIKWSEMWNNILNSLIDYVNAILDWIRPVLQGIDAIVGFFGGSTNLGGWHINNIPAPAAYATGGMPEDGMFFANHGELVGQFSNGKTAVANNEQITEGIAKAVYEAFVEAFTQTNGGGNDQPVNLYLDGKLIAESTTRYQRQFARANG